MLIICYVSCMIVMLQFHSLLVISNKQGNIEITVCLLLSSFCVSNEDGLVYFNFGIFSFLFMAMSPFFGPVCNCLSHGYME